MTEFKFGLICVLAFLFTAIAFVLASLIASSIVRPSRPSREKKSAYECGERPIGQAWFNFNPRFYIIALIFLIFDVEVAFIFPVAAVYREMTSQGSGVLALGEIVLFLAILSVGLGYVWRKGDLDWLKHLDHETRTIERRRS